MAKKEKLLSLRDTRGNFYMNIKLPTKDYKPKSMENFKHRKQKIAIKPRNRKEYNKQWYSKNRKKKLAYYRKNRKHILEQKKEYQNRPHVKARKKALAKQHYLENRDKILKRQRRYDKAIRKKALVSLRKRDI